ncbi:MAG: hypothetical protein JW750_06920 [Anaerolineaceae bacterium]|nr:hypothetical protein [Anaerolineaceae bacterium]
MKIGAWIHGYDAPISEHILQAHTYGLESVRSYGIDYSREAAPVLRQTGMSLLAGMHIDSEALAADWRSQLRFDELAANFELDCDLEGICVGNELREGGDDPAAKRFTARLSFGLANVLDQYRTWMANHGVSAPLTYANECIAADEVGMFHEWMWPLIDACDVVALNHYPLPNEAWFTYGAFDRSKAMMEDPREQHDRFVLFELRLRNYLAQLASVNRPMLFSETGFPSAVGYSLGAEVEPGQKLVLPLTDGKLYGEAMERFIGIIHQVNQEYDKPIQSLYFYEWRDNLYHRKIWNIEQSPIHTAFGLCDRFGTPKFDLKILFDR